jgi:hypothetical protein
MPNPSAPFDYPTSTPPTERSNGNQRPFITSGDIKQITGPVENLILKYPGAALASAFVVGVFVAWLIKRK